MKMLDNDGNEVLVPLCSKDGWEQRISPSKFGFVLYEKDETTTPMVMFSVTLECVEMVRDLKDRETFLPTGRRHVFSRASAAHEDDLTSQVNALYDVNEYVCNITGNPKPSKRVFKKQIEQGNME